MSEVIRPCLMLTVTLISAWNLPYQRQTSFVVML